MRCMVTALFRSNRSSNRALSLASFQTEAAEKTFLPLPYYIQLMLSIAAQFTGPNSDTVLISAISSHGLETVTYSKSKVLL